MKDAISLILPELRKEKDEDFNFTMDLSLLGFLPPAISDFLFTGNADDDVRATIQSMKSIDPPLEIISYKERSSLPEFLDRLELAVNGKESDLTEFLFEAGFYIPFNEQGRKLFESIEQYLIQTYQLEDEDLSFSISMRNGNLYYDKVSIFPLAITSKLSNEDRERKILSFINESESILNIESEILKIKTTHEIYGKNAALIKSRVVFDGSVTLESASVKLYNYCQYLTLSQGRHRKGRVNVKFIFDRKTLESELSLIVNI